METKKCSKCKKELTLDKFGKSKKNKDGLKCACKKCLKLEAIKYKEENWDEIKLRNKKYKEGNKDIIKVKNKIYSDKEERREEVRKYNKKNKIKFKVRDKKYRKEHPEKCIKTKESSRKYREKNKDKISQYKKDNRDKCNVISQRRRTRKKLLLSTLTIEEWKDCLDFFNCKDAYTGLDMKIISQDHIIPLSKNGCYVRENIIPCEKCVNSSKNNSDMELWYKSQTFYDEERLNKIYEWIGFENNNQQLAPIN